MYADRPLPAEHSSACCCQWPAGGSTPTGHPDCPWHWDLIERPFEQVLGEDERHDA